ncbi:MAG: hypothetical protein LBG60_06100 [Bifidobacteriaceae bacterium]|jgi:hypothetical protein|nr:hypothetical protein [Bifidobacteriaceae bacterium]
MRFNLIMTCIGGCVAVILGIMSVAWNLAPIAGVVFLIGGVIMFLSSFAALKKVKADQAAGAQQMAEVQHAQANPPMPGWAEVLVQIDSTLPRGRFTVYLNGGRAGDIRPGEVIRLHTDRRSNVAEVGKLNGAPFKWPEARCLFEADPAQGPVRLLITHRDLLIMLVRV